MGSRGLEGSDPLRRYSSLNRTAARPQRKGDHPVRPAWEDECLPESTDAEGSVSGLRQSGEYVELRLERAVHAGNLCEAGPALILAGRTGGARWDGCRLVGTELHHVYPTSEGGPVLAPVVWTRWVCQPCHQRIHHVTTRQVAESLGLVVPMDRKPVGWPLGAVNEPDAETG